MEHHKAQQLDGRMHRLLREQHRLMHQHFRECGLFNGEPPMLFHIGECAGITQRELAERMRITPASVTVSIRRMEAEGLVRRVSDERDSRRLHLYLTEQGEMLNRRCLKARDELIDLLYQEYGEEEYQQLQALFDKMEQRVQHAREVFLSKGDNSQ